RAEEIADQLALEPLHRDVRRVAAGDAVSEVPDDAGVRQLGHHAHLAREAFAACRGAAGQHLDGDRRAGDAVARPEHPAHAAGPGGRAELVPAVDAHACLHPASCGRRPPRVTANRVDQPQECITWKSPAFSRTPPRTAYTRNHAWSGNMPR